MVAPSLEMVTDRPEEMSLSMPRGPRVVRMASDMAWHALMLEISWAFPCEDRVQVVAEDYGVRTLICKIEIGKGWTAGERQNSPEKCQFPPAAK